MTVLVVGATGATGRLLVRQLLEHGRQVRAVVRPPARLPDDIREHGALEIIEASLLDLDDAALAGLVRGCSAVASCLGHNLSMKGIWGRPRRLVADAVRRLCAAIEATGPARPVRFVLMGSAGVRNRDLDEKIPAAQHAVLALLRAAVPPHADNEQAAEALRVGVGPQHSVIEWVVVRPDGLIDRDAVEPYDVHPSPTRSAIFNSGKTSRIQVAHFIADLMTDDGAWSAWRGRMPVLYDGANPDSR